jgi:ribose transport system permease protein
MRYFSRLAEFAERFGLLALLVVEIVFFSLNPATSVFSSRINLTNIVGNESLIGVLVIATVIPLVAGQIDLSVGPTAGLGAILCSGLMSRSGWPLILAILGALVVGLFIGVVNGVLVTKFSINSIIATLGTSSIISAAVVAYSGGLSFVSGISTTLTNLGSGTWLGVPKPTYVLVLVAFVVWYVLDKTPVGKNAYAAGSSPRAAQLVGIDVPRLTIACFVTAGGMAGMSGVVLVAVSGTGNPELGPNFTLPAIAAAFLGATTLQPGRYNVWGSVTAVFFLAVSVNGLTLWGAAPWVSDVFNGAALLAGVGLAVYAGKVRERRVPGARGPEKLTGSEHPVDAADAEEPGLVGKGQ